jgi:hypothetical protein
LCRWYAFSHSDIFADSYAKRYSKPDGYSKCHCKSHGYPERDSYRYDKP